MFNKIGPHYNSATSTSIQFGSQAPIVKAFADPGPLGQVRPGAITIYRKYFLDQSIYRNGGDVAREVIAELGGFRPTYIELFNETAQRLGAGLERYVQFHAEAAPVVHAAGMLLAGYCFSTGNTQQDEYLYLQSQGFGSVDAIAIHEYWGNGDPVFGRFSPYHALRHREAHQWMGGNHPPFIITECGRDAVEGGGPGWKVSGITKEQYFAELSEYDALISQDGYVLGATIFIAGSDPTWQFFNVDDFVDLILGGPPPTCQPQGPSARLKELVSNYPNFIIQMVEWQSARYANGENPYDWGALRTHLYNLSGWFDPGDPPPPEFDPFTANYSARLKQIAGGNVWFVLQMQAWQTDRQATGQNACDWAAFKAFQVGIGAPDPGDPPPPEFGASGPPPPTCNVTAQLRVNDASGPTGVTINSGDKVHFWADIRGCSIGQDCNGYLVYGDGTPNDMNPDHVYVNQTGQPLYFQARAHIDGPGSCKTDSNVVDITVNPVGGGGLLIQIAADKAVITNGDSVHFTVTQIDSRCIIGQNCAGYIVYGDGTPNSMNPDHVYHFDPGVLLPITIQAFAHIDIPGVGSGDSNMIGITVNPGGATTPTAPGSLRITGQAVSQVELAWDRESSANEDGFVVEASIPGEVWRRVAITGPGVTSVVIGDLVSDTIIQFRVYAFNAYGPSPFSNIVNVLLFGEPPPAPSNLVATAVSTTEIDLSWVPG